MGYYTNINMTISPEPNQEDELKIMRMIASFVDEVPEERISDNHAFWCLCDAVKWYDRIDDMIVVSRRFPEYTFVLDGEGEDSDDIWREFYHNGEWEGIEAQIMFPKPRNPKFQEFM